MDIEDDLILLECYDKNFLILEESSDQEEIFLLIKILIQNYCLPLILKSLSLIYK